MEVAQITLVPESVLDAVRTKLNEVMDMIKPYTGTLSPGDRHNILKMGPKSTNFVTKAYELAKRNPSLVPSYIDIGKFSLQFNNASNVWALITLARQIERMLDDTQMLNGSEAYYAALGFYGSIKAASRQGVIGARILYDELKIFFKNRKRLPEEKDLDDIQ